MAEFDIKLYNPSKLDTADYAELQGIEREAYGATLDLNKVGQAGIDALVDWGDIDRFEASHVDSSTELGKRFNNNQVWANGQIAIATAQVDGFRKRVGWGSAYWNVSYGPRGGPQDDSFKAQAIRAVKLGSVIVPPPFSAKVNKNYLALRDIAVDPNFMRRGIGRQILGSLLRVPTTVPWQHVTFYDWPDIDPEWMRPKLQEYGLKPKGGGRPMRVFGEDGPLVRQDRLEAPTAFGVLRHAHRRTGRRS